MEAVRERGNRAGAGRLRSTRRSSRRSPAPTRHAIERIVLTASGGPFRTWSLEQLAHARRPQQALCHPNWSMGRKITIDSATLMNKGLELIEAYHLFPVRAGTSSRWWCIPSRSSTRWSAIATARCWRSWRAPTCARRSPLSLAWPARMAAPTKRLDLVELGPLSFERPDEHRFQALGLARQAMQQGGMAPAVLNAANEVAVEAFLTRRLGFLQIAQLVAETLEMADGRGLLAAATDLDEVLATDAAARELALNLLETMAVRGRLMPWAAIAVWRLECDGGTLAWCCWSQCR